MIKLPKFIDAIGNDCLVACVTMVCMYWREKKQDSSWNLSLDFDNKEWDDILKKGQTYVRISGMPFNNVAHFLRRLKIPLSARLVHLEDVYGLTDLIYRDVPPIVLYDRNYFLKHIHGIGHAAILVDHTKELFISIDPSLGEKYTFKLPKDDFAEAWESKQNATIIICPKSYTVRETKIPSTTLMEYLSKGEKTK